jgi:hypothetical protein
MSFINKMRLPVWRMKPPVNAPPTKRPAKLGHGRWLRQLLESGDFSIALTNCQYERLLMTNPCFNRTGKIL